MKKSIYFFKTLFLAVLFSSGVSLMAQTPEIELQQPTGGETWTGGGTYLISWLDNFNGNVDALYKHVYADPCDNFTKTANTYTLNNVITDLQNELGTDYTLADWNDITEMNSADRNSLFACVMTNNLQLWITKDGEEFTATGRHYIVKYTDIDPGGAWVNLDGTNLYWNSISSNTAERGILAKHIDSDYQKITPNNGTSGSTCYWHTNNLPLGEYQIKVRSNNVPDNNDYADESGLLYLVDQEEGEITLIQPNGEEIWPLGTTQIISWTDNLNEPVKIEYSTDDINWFIVNASVAGSTYEWPISGINAGEYKVRISSTVANATTLPAISSDYFTVSATSGTEIEVLQPNEANIQWAQGTRHLVSWNDDVVGNVDVYWVNYDPSGTTFGLIESNVEGSTLYWDIPSDLAIGDQYKIKMWSTLDHNIVDWSDNFFEISKSEGEFIQVLQPNELNTSWARGTSHLISWIDDLPENVKVELVNYGVTPNTFTTIAPSVEGTTHVWTIPSNTPTGNQYRIKIISLLDNSIVDWSDEYFSVTASAGTTVEVLQPSITGISWQGGTQHLISWVDDCPEPMSIQLVDYSTNPSGDFTQIATGVIGSTYVWDVPDNVTFGNHFKIKVYSTLNNAVAAKSSNYFDITGSLGTYITILQPEGGEVWQANQAYYISWEDDFLEGVNIELWNNGSYAQDLVSNRLGSTWVWDIPLGFTESTNYSIYIESVNTGGPAQESNEFTVIPYVMLNAYPNPASNMLTLEVTGPSEQLYQISVYDRFNTEVYSTSVNSGGINQVNISTQDFPNGVYFLNVSSNTYNASRKIIVNHR